MNMRALGRQVALVLFLGLVLLLIPLISRAASGACSYHGGVDCSAGTDWDGSVVCNDGWRDSSVSYGSMVMCGGGYGYTPYTPLPSCPTFSSYDSLSGSCKCNYGYTVSGNQCVSLDSACQSQLGFGARYNSLYDTCECGYGEIIDGGRCTNGNSVCHRKYGIWSSYVSYAKKCECDSGYIFDSNMQCVSENTACQNEYGPNAESKYSGNCGCKNDYVFNAAQTACVLEKVYVPPVIPAPLNCPANAVALGDTCYCITGYIQSGNQCISYSESCRNQYGAHSYGDQTNCYCDIGYVFNAAQTECVLKAVPSSTQRAAPYSAIIVPVPINKSITPKQQASEPHSTTSISISSSTTTSSNTMVTTPVKKSLWRRFWDAIIRRQG